MNCGQVCQYNTFTGCKVKEYNGICPLSNICPDRTEKPMTNADRIRSMSDEELIAFFVLEDKCPPERYSSRKCDRFDSCKDCWIDWLKEPVEDE